jgi:hypothetical protein
VRIHKNLPIWKLKDNYFNVEWTHQIYSYAGRPVFKARYSGKYYFLYYNDADLTGLGSSFWCIFTEVGYPCSEKQRLVYDSSTGGAKIENVWDNCFYNSGGLSDNMTFEGRGSFEGKTMTINFNLNTSEVWIKNSSKTNALGEYVPYSGTYGDFSNSLDGNHYLGCKYWTSSKNVPDMSKNSGYVKMSL